MKKFILKKSSKPKDVLVNCGWVYHCSYFVH